MLLNLSTSQYAVNRNYQELSLAINNYEVNWEIWDVQKRQIFHAFMRELSRLLHNYLSSTFSLIRHNVKLCKDLQCSTLNKEYALKIEVLNKNDCFLFIKDLRNFSQHVGLPVLSAQLNIHNRQDKGQEIKQRILLDKGALLEDSKNWNRDSRAYIQAHKDIDLKLVLYEYQELIKWFYDWFYKRVTELYAKELNEMHEIESKIIEIEGRQNTIS